MHQWTKCVSQAAFQTQVNLRTNQILSQIRFSGLTVHTVFSKCPNGFWLWFRLGHIIVIVTAMAPYDLARCVLRRVE